MTMEEAAVTEPDVPGALTAPEPGHAAAGDAVAQPPSKDLARLRRRLVLLASIACCGVILFAAYLAHARTQAASFNGAGQVLQAWDMMHGNVLLHGWTVSDVSFYTTELPEYVLVELVRGMNGDTVHVAAALSYTLAVIGAAVLARGRATGRAGLVRMLVTGGIMAAPTLYEGTNLYLSGPDHAGTQVGLLLIWLMLDRLRPRWWVPAVIALLLAWTQVADMIVLIEGVLPLVIVCAWRMLRRRGPLAGQWYELSLAVGAIASVVAARLALGVIRHFGGFYVTMPAPGLSLGALTPANLPSRVQGILGVFAARFTFPPVAFAGIEGLAHLLGIALVVWAVLAVMRRLGAGEEIMPQVLTCACIALLAAWMLSHRPDANEIVGLLPMGAVLAGRMLGDRLSRTAVLPAVVVVLVCFSVALVSDASHPAQRSHDRIVAWLAAHHLTYGLASYWGANMLTADSGNRVQLRPVRMFDRMLVTTPNENNAAWYDPGQHDARFVLTQRGGCRNLCLSVPDLRRIYGPPVEVYHVAGQEVLVWKQNLLTGLSTLSWCGRGFPWAAKSIPSRTHCPEDLLRI